MSRPQHLRRPSGKAKGGSIADKDDHAEATQRNHQADLLERFRRRVAAPAPAPTDGGPR
ncbi:hypothetical protein ACIGW8_06215 [Streptomyces sioyaensis]|uniref:hypothetical protein n=1 Tax=Streptomyces sioyaensis TaxID=67364 RepID=UPI0037D543D6